MTYYESEVKRFASIVYSNKEQLEAVIATRNYINNNYDTNLNLDLLSHIRFISKFHLLRLFKQYYGQTPNRYLIDKRLEKAREHLKKGISISETCYAIGFESPSSFSTLFKSRTGLTPTEFQKQQFSQSRFNRDFETLES